ncbi:MAG: DUF6323 family protein [Clostridium sp.]|uniref:DUF6323 family protein n=1 Tax=Clostridium sp. TaxID=1506 RepID=UPI00290682B8|nr:DUF6323 family protein [Clostridium sp.]MDU7337520.1 DUF6323 family protein [Clostridium sp.]
MGFELGFLNQGLIQKQAVGDILKCNEISARFGLQLTEQQAVQLVETRAFALKTAGRVEFGGGVIQKLIYAFSDSPYLMNQNYESTLHELVELFYFYKNETEDRISDDELIDYMKKAYDGPCAGSLQLLAGRELYRLAENLRWRRPAEYNEDLVNEEEEDEDELSGTN